MSLENLRSLIPMFATDLIGVYDKNFKQLFAGARPLKVNVKEEAKLMEHPLENGATIVDHRVVLPIEIEIALIPISGRYRDIYEEIRQLFFNATLLTVQTKTGVYENQLIQGMPHDEETAMYDTVGIALKLKQAQFITPEYGVVPRRAQDASNVDRGNQQTTKGDNTSKLKELYG